MTSDPDPRRFAPATERNREPILAVLREVLPAAGLVLEIASGTGEHAAFFAGAMPALVWQPSDPGPEQRASIDSWARTQDMPNVRPALAIDAARERWAIAAADAIVCINMLHISPWEATEGLMRGSGRLLGPGAPLVVYGPFRRADRPLEPSNAAFDGDLRSRDPRWGLRSVAAVESCAEGQGLALERVIELPANNLVVVFRRG